MVRCGAVWCGKGEGGDGGMAINCCGEERDGCDIINAQTA